MVTVKWGEGRSALPATAANMTRAFLQTFSQRYRFIAPNIHVSGGFEMDILGIRRSGFVDEVEIKISRSDFLADFKKTACVGTIQDIQNYGYIPKHDAAAAGQTLANYFSFLMPSTLAEQCLPDIPDYAGLYVFEPDMDGGTIKTIKRAPRLHKDTVPDSAERRYLNVVWRRYRRILVDNPIWIHEAFSDESAEAA